MNCFGIPGVQVDVQEVGVLAKSAHYDLLEAARVHAGHFLAMRQVIKVHFPGDAQLYDVIDFARLVQAQQPHKVIMEARQVQQVYSAP